MPKVRKRTRNRQGPNYKNRATAQIKGTGVSAAVATNFGSHSRGSTITVAQTERIGTVQGSVLFQTAIALKCNPGLIESFPWLSAQANLYEKYRFKKLTFRYKNLKGSATDGNILMSFDYDSLDAPPTTGQEVTQMTLYQDGAPWRMFSMNVPCSGPWLYTRDRLPPAGGDLKTYDLGQLFLSAEACADTSIHGYLEVDYIVQLEKKQPTTRTPAVPTPYLQFAGTVQETTGDVFTTGVPIRFGTNLTANSWRLVTNTAVFGEAHADNTFTLKSGWYKLDVHCAVVNSNPSIQGTIIEWFINGALPDTGETANTHIQILGTDIENECVTASRLVLIPKGLAGDVGTLQLVTTQTDPLDAQYIEQLQLELQRVADAPAVLATSLVDPLSLISDKYQIGTPAEEEKEQDAQPIHRVSEPIEIPQRLRRQRSRRASPSPSLRSSDGELVVNPGKPAARS